MYVLGARGTIASKTGVSGEGDKTDDTRKKITAVLEPRGRKPSAVGRRYIGTNSAFGLQMYLLFTIQYTLLKSQTNVDSPTFKKLKTAVVLSQLGGPQDVRQRFGNFSNFG